MILVTGATGLVGSHLLYNLVSAKKHVKAIYRRAHKLESVKHVFSYYTDDFETLFNAIEWIEADINDVPTLAEAFNDVTYVYHCAAFVSFEPDKYHLLRKINIEGTANIVNLCVAHHIKKLCYVSSVAAIGHHQNAEELITEETHWNPEEDNSVYAITKYGAEIEVWRGTQEGVATVIVNPGVIIGPGFWKNGGSSSLIRQVYKGFPYFANGSTGYVDVWNVVSIMTKLMESDIKNERFILVSDNLTFKEFNKKVAKGLGVAPAKKEASKLILELGWRLDWLKHKLFGKRRKLSKQLAKTARTVTLYDASKLKNTLNFKFNAIDDSIKKTSNLFLKDLDKD
ncbi:MAG: NAD-dependent epimerase/dehydratase family protein [Gelidibacter sp.]